MFSINKIVIFVTLCYKRVSDLGSFKLSMMNEFAASELLTTVITVFALVAATSWLLMAGPLAIFRHASFRYASANFFISFGMGYSLLRVESGHISLWLISDVALFFGVFLYKKAVYRQFKLPSNKMFDQAALTGIAFAVFISLVFTVDYIQVAIIITLICAATCAMTVYAMYHSLVLNISRFSSGLLALPVFILSSLLFTKSITLWLIPKSVQHLFLQEQVDSAPILWIYLIIFVLINIFAAGAALMLLIFKIKRLADHDQLTELLNRHAIFRELSRAHKLFLRDSVVFSVLLIDVDFFKRINDTMGHDAGDAAIKHISTLMLSELRETDRLARYGGEEFLALLTNCNIEQAKNVAEKLRLRIEQTPFQWNNETFELTISIGVSSIKHTEDVKQLVIQADKALYQAKQSGRNLVALGSAL